MLTAILNQMKDNLMNNIEKLAERSAVVSVIIPAYNAEQYLKRCINSLDRQIGCSLEIILVDDGSVDGTWKVCSDLKKNHPGLVTIQQNNRGVSAARNCGLDRATGEYVLFLDADDELECGAIEKLLFCAQEQNADFVICGFTYVYWKRQEKMIPMLPEPLCSTKDVFQNFWENYRSGTLHNVGTKLYRREFLRQKCHNLHFDENATVLEDIKFCMQAIEHARVIGVVSLSLYRYHMSDNVSSIQKTYRKAYFEQLNVFFNHLFDIGILKNKDFYMVYMDAVLLALRNELYERKVNNDKIRKVYCLICEDAMVKESRKWILRSDVCYTKFLFYQAIWKGKIWRLFFMMRLWDKLTER